MPRRAVLVLWLATFARLSGIAAEPDNIVLRWNAAMLDAIRTETTAPPLAARNLAILHVVLDEVAGLSDEPDESALLEAGRAVCESLYPGQAPHFESALGKGSLPLSANARRAHEVARRVLDDRADDGATRFVIYIPREEPGQWRRTPPFFRQPELPQWPQLRPFTRALADVISIPGPPAWESAAFSEACEEVKRLGGKGSPHRTAEQTLIAKFWSDFSYTVMPPGHWDVIAAVVARDRRLDVRQTARLFALLNVAQSDAAVACWEAKYRFNAWRPVTALNARRIAGTAEWQTLLPTPPHPEYPSGHSVFSGAAAEVLAAFFGSDECVYDVTSDAVPGVVRTFRRFSDAADEIGRSRVYAGIHFTYACRDGLELGRRIGRAVAREAGLTPVSREGTQ